MNWRRDEMDTKRAEFWRFASFAVTGGIAALANLLARYLMMRFMSYEIAVALAYLVGMVVAFVLARSFVFLSGDRSVASQFGRFAIVNLFAFIQVWIVTIGLDRFVFPATGFSWHPEEVAHFIGVISPIMLSYYGHKHFSFKRSDTPPIFRG
jgi:putative flippase GtrA